MLIAWDNLADDATVAASSEQSSAPGANVQNEHISKKWMAVEGVTSASLVFDMGSSVACAILAVLGSNMTASATLRLRGSDSDSTGATGELYDSTLINAGAKVGYGAAYLSFVSATARYWRLDLADASLTTLQVGRVFLGPKWTPLGNQAFGWSVVSQDNSKVAKSYGGQSFIDNRPAPRIIQFTLSYSRATAEADMYGNAFAMVRAQGVARDVLAINDTAASGYLSEQSVYGLCTASEPIVNENYNIFRQKFTIEERL
jgi:hypothetical protein